MSTNPMGINTDTLTDTLLILGCGLIGTSLAAGLSQAGYEGKIYGYARRAETVVKATGSGWFDGASSDVSDWAGVTDIIVLCAPLSAIPELLQAIKPHLQANTVITDVGSVKQPVIDAVQTYLPECSPQVVPGHPIAGSEQSGFDAGKPDLFQGRRVILTPLPNTHVEAISKVTRLWQRVQATVVSMSVDMHDRVLATSSHLPHLVAFAYVEALLGKEVASTDVEQVIANAAGGLRDFTRIAASDPIMWRDILLTNQTEVLSALQRFQEKLQHVEGLLKAGDATGILALCQAAKAVRTQFSSELD